MKRTFGLIVLSMASPTLAPTLAWSASTSPAKQALVLYKKGAYAQAIEKLSLSREDGLSAYWKGICYARLQKFEQAVATLERAKKMGFTSEDLDYEYGQALYASQRLRPARDAFRQSVAKGYKTGPSQYYIGFISQILEELAAANSAYGTLKALPREKDVDKVKQPALLQLAELHYAKARTVTDARVRTKQLRTEVLPGYQLAMNYEKNTPAYYQAEARVNEIRRVLGTDIPRFANGVPIAAKLWVIKGSQDVKYDTNVVAEADQASTRVSNAASAISKTNLFLKYEAIIGNRWSVSPDFTADYTYHLNQEVGSVYANDQLSLTPVLRIRNEHRYDNQPAAFLFDIEYNNLRRDYTQVHQLSAYSSYFNFTAAERGRFLTDAGNFTVQAGFKTLSHYDSNQSSIDPSLTFLQNLPMGGHDNLSLTWALDYNIARLDTYSKFNSRVSASYALADLWWNLNLTLGMNVTLSKLINASENASRGIEGTYNPSLTLRKDFGPNLFLGINYAYTKQTSQDTTSYAYSKNVFGLNLGALL